jgi:hypothetical protein
MVWVRHHLERNAMGTSNAFVTKFAASIVAVLSCFDRVIFKGHLPFGGDQHLNRFVDHVLKMRRKDFLPFLEGQSAQLVAHAQALAEQHGAPYVYLQGRHRKEEVVRQTIRERRLDEGLVCVLCCQETCRTVKLLHGQGRPRLAFTWKPQRVLYFYWLDPDFGLRHVRVQSWFPFTTQAYVNGHDWLARQLHQAGVGFVQHDNAFTQLDDPERAQALAERFAQLPWAKLLDRWAREVNPLLGQPWLQDRGYYWVADQAEYSTDVLFKDREALAGLYPRLLDHALVNFQAQDILTFLGRRLHPRFDGEVLTDCKKDRLPGARIKHRVKNNWLKMYDKFGQVLRIETVINQPREFKVRRRRQRQGRWQLVWCPMNKGVSNLGRYRQVAGAANGRYLEALAVVQDPAPAYRRVEALVRPQVQAGRSHAGFNPARREDVRLFAAVLDGAQALRGFRNADIRRQLYGDSPDPARRRRQATAVSRLLKRLHVRGLIAKVPRSRRWRVTAKGHSVLGAVVRLYHQVLLAVA